MLIEYFDEEEVGEIIVEVGERFGEVQLRGAEEGATLFGDELLRSYFDSKPALLVDHFFLFLIGGRVLDLEIAQGFDFLNDELQSHLSYNKLII